MKKIPIFPESRKLTIDDKNGIENFVKRFPPFSDYNFTSLYCYNVNDKVEISRLNDNLVVRFQDYISDELFYSFMGDNKVNETIMTILNYTESIGMTAELRLIPDFTTKALNGQHLFSITEDRDSHDYILSVSSLCSYEGEKFRQKRYSSKKFASSNDYITTATMDLNRPDTKEKIFELSNTLENNKEKSFAQTHELPALKRLLESSNLLDTFCFGVFVKNKLSSFIIYEVLNDKFAIGHFEKSDLTFEGIAPFLIQEFSKELKKNGQEYFNYEQDLGIEGLRTMKQRFRPSDFLKKYKVTLSKLKCRTADKSTRN